MSHENPVPGSYKFDRRSLLLGTGTAAVAALGAPLLLRAIEPRTPVFLAANQRYDGPLEQTIRDGLLATGLDPAQLRGKLVLLKPNMVEPNRASPHMTTHPAMVRATAEVFRRWDAKVVVGEAPGHVRDTEMALVESGLGVALDADKIDFADLNYEEVGWAKNLQNVCKLPGFFFPKAVLEADLIVSMPKLKTHHWVGMTASLKNMYGTLPGIKYGWPKNVLHHNGIPETVVDINGALKKTIAVIDAITCMEGDGPIMGSPKSLGVVGVSTNPTALDATCARIMELDPTLMEYLHLSNRRLGPIQDSMITQRGEDWRKLKTPFKVLDRPYLKRMQVRPAGELTS